MQTLSQALSKFESFTSLKTAQQGDTKIAIAMFGSQKEAEKTETVMINDNQSVHMQPMQLINPLDAKTKSIRAWDIPLNTNTQEVQAVFFQIWNNQEHQNDHHRDVAKRNY
jgi:hypothetical protein